MHFAAANGHLGVVTMLVERGADVTRTNSEGGTPVHVAAQRGHTDIVKYLSAHGGDLNQPNSTGEAARRSSAAHLWKWTTQPKSVYPTESNSHHPRSHDALLCAVLGGPATLNPKP
jgi:ankyrin repeat protein